MAKAKRTPPKRKGPKRAAPPPRKAPPKRKRTAAAVAGRPRPKPKAAHHTRLMESPTAQTIFLLTVGAIGGLLLDLAADQEGVSRAGPVGPGTVVGGVVVAGSLTGQLGMADSKTGLAVGAGTLLLPLFRILSGRPTARPEEAPRTDAEWITLVERRYGADAAQLVAQRTGLALPAPELTQPEAVPDRVPVAAETAA